MESKAVGFKLVNNGIGYPELIFLIGIQRGFNVFVVQNRLIESVDIQFTVLSRCTGYTAQRYQHQQNSASEDSARC